MDALIHRPLVRDTNGILLPVRGCLHADLVRLENWPLGLNVSTIAMPTTAQKRRDPHVLPSPAVTGWYHSPRANLAPMLSKNLARHKEPERASSSTGFGQNRPQSWPAFGQTAFGQTAFGQFGVLMFCPNFLHWPMLLFVTACWPNRIWPIVGVLMLLVQMFLVVYCLLLFVVVGCCCCWLLLVVVCCCLLLPVVACCCLFACCCLLLPVVACCCLLLPVVACCFRR